MERSWLEFNGEICRVSYARATKKREWEREREKEIKEVKKCSIGDAILLLHQQFTLATDI